MAALQQIKGSLRDVKESVVLDLVILLPVKGSDGSQAVQCLKEVRIERAFGLQVQESKLSGRLQVDVLQTVYGKKDNGDRCSEINGARGDETNTGKALDNIWPAETQY